MSNTSPVPDPGGGSAPARTEPNHPGSKTNRRAAFLETCRPATRRIHEPIVDIAAARGHLNPAGLGRARAVSARGSLGQSSVGFDTLASYETADASGEADHGGAEYGVVRTPEADAVCARFAALHGGAGAIVCPSGLSAIAITIDAFAPKAIVGPDCIYGPARRYVAETGRAALLTHAGDASGAAVAAILAEARTLYDPAEIMLYIEAPGSGTFEIPDLEGMVAAARQAGIRTVMDNTWASHVRFRPIEHGVDVVIQATTKYEGGYGDTPSGIVVARGTEDLARLRRQLRISGHGAVSPQTCTRLLHRVDTAAARLDRHARTADRLIGWFEAQPFVTDIVSPTHPASPQHDRFRRYFGAGNGLFTVRFDGSHGAGPIRAFVDALLLFRVAESWGGHVSLVLPVRRPPGSTGGPMVRFHAGLEDARDLVADLDAAAASAMRAFWPVG